MPILWYAGISFTDHIDSTLKALIKAFYESTRDLIPIVVVIAFFQLLVLQQPFPGLLKMLGGLLMVVLGLTLFVHGLRTGLFPIGEAMAYDFARKGSLPWLLLFAFALGFGTTVAEPALIAVADEAAEVAANGGMIASTEAAMERYADCARAMGLTEQSTDEETAVDKLLAELRQLNTDLKVPSPKEYGISEEKYFSLLTTMAEQALASGSPNNNPLVPSVQDITTLYTTAWGDT